LSPSTCESQPAASSPVSIPPQSSAQTFTEHAVPSVCGSRRREFEPAAVDRGRDRRELWVRSLRDEAVPAIDDHPAAVPFKPGLGHTCALEVDAAAGLDRIDVQAGDAGHGLILARVEHVITRAASEKRRELVEHMQRGLGRGPDIAMRVGMHLARVIGAFQLLEFLAPGGHG